MRLLAFVSALVLSGAALAQKEVAVRFALDWRFEGPAAPYFVAIDKGYYKQEGLNVSIDPGSGSGSYFPLPFKGTMREALPPSIDL